MTSSRHSRESGNPDEASTRRAASDAALNPRFRGDDELLLKGSPPC
jgi:hypothetical protein